MAIFNDNNKKSVAKTKQFTQGGSQGTIFGGSVQKSIADDEAGSTPSTVAIYDDGVLVEASVHSIDFDEGLEVTETDGTVVVTGAASVTEVPFTNSVDGLVEAPDLEFGSDEAQFVLYADNEFRSSAPPITKEGSSEVHFPGATDASRRYSQLVLGDHLSLTNDGSGSVTIDATDTNTTYTFTEGVEASGTLVKLSDEILDNSLDVIQQARFGGQDVLFDLWRPGDSAGFLFATDVSDASTRLDDDDFGLVAGSFNRSIKDLSVAGTVFELRTSEGNLTIGPLTVSSTVALNNASVWVRVEETVVASSFVTGVNASGLDIEPEDGLDVQLHIYNQDVGEGLKPDFDTGGVAVDFDAVQGRLTAGNGISIADDNTITASSSVDLDDILGKTLGGLGQDIDSHIVNTPFALDETQGDISANFVSFQLNNSDNLFFLVLDGAGSTLQDFRDATNHRTKLRVNNSVFTADIALGKLALNSTDVFEDEALFAVPFDQVETLTGTIPTNVDFPDDVEVYAYTPEITGLTIQSMDDDFAAGDRVTLTTAATGLTITADNQLVTDAVTTDIIIDDAVTNAKMADDAVGIAELSATGTASSTTFLRGDNAWATVPAGNGSIQDLDGLQTFGNLNSGNGTFTASTNDATSTDTLFVGVDSSNGEYSITARKVDIDLEQIYTANTLDVYYVVNSAIKEGFYRIVAATEGSVDTDIDIIVAGNVITGEDPLADFVNPSADIASISFLAEDRVKLYGSADIANGDVGTNELADGAVTEAKLADNAVTNVKMADDAVGIAELSATGTPSASTYLRGDNSWATVSGGGGSSFIVDNYAGTAATATGADSLAIGDGATAAGIDGIAVGRGATATFDETIIIGTNAKVEIASDAADGAAADGSIAIGRLAEVSVPTSGEGARQGIAIGERALVQGANSIAIGGDNTDSTKTTATGNRAIAMGLGANASGNDTLALGQGSAASANDAVAIGRDTIASAIDTVVVGVASTATATDAVAMGMTSSATGVASVAIGKDASTQAADAVAMGDSVIAQGANSVAMGSTTTATNPDSIAIGSDADATGDQSLAIGRLVNAANTDAIAIGVSVDVDNAGGIGIGKSIANVEVDSVAIGNGAETQGERSVAVGHSVSANGTEAVSIGTQKANSINPTTADGDNAISIGSGSEGTQDDAIAIGERAIVEGSGNTAGIAIGDAANVSHDNSIALGKDSTSTADFQLMIGSSTSITGIVSPGFTAPAGAPIYPNANGTWSVGSAKALDARLKFEADKTISRNADGSVLSVGFDLNSTDYFKLISRNANGSVATTKLYSGTSAVDDNIIYTLTITRNTDGSVLSTAYS